jgi:hypothetical protein
MSSERAESRFLAAIEVDIFNVECMNVPRDVTENSEEDVDEEVNAAAGDQEDTHGRHCGKVISDALWHS